MSVTYHGDHASLSTLPSDNHHQYLHDLNNWSTADNISIANGTTSSNFYTTYSGSWDTNPIDVISIDNEGKLSVHKLLVDAIMNMIMSNEELKEKLLSMLMERVLQKSDKLKINASELQKTFS